MDYPAESPFAGWWDSEQAMGRSEGRAVWRGPVSRQSWVLARKGSPGVKGHLFTPRPGSAWSPSWGYF